MVSSVTGLLGFDEKFGRKPGSSARIAGLEYSIAELKRKGGNEGKIADLNKELKELKGSESSGISSLALGGGNVMAMAKAAGIDTSGWMSAEQIARGEHKRNIRMTGYDSSSAIDRFRPPRPSNIIVMPVAVPVFVPVAQVIPRVMPRFGFYTSYI